MYKSFSQSVLEEMEERGGILLTIKPGWEQSTEWCAQPFFISYCMGLQREHIFSCYLSKENGAIQIVNLEATELIKDKKSLVDAYMYVTLKGLIKHAKNMGATRLIVDSYIPATADHMLDLGFYITPKGMTGGARGCKKLKE